MLDYTTQANELKAQIDAVISSGKQEVLTQTVQQLLTMMQNVNGTKTVVANTQPEITVVESKIDADNSVFNTPFNFQTKSGVAKIMSGKKKDGIIAFQGGMVVKSYSNGYESDKFANGTYELTCGYSIRLFRSRITAIVPNGQEFPDKAPVKRNGEVSPLVHSMLSVVRK